MGYPFLERFNANLDPINPAPPVIKILLFPFQTFMIINFNYSSWSAYNYRIWREFPLTTELAPTIHCSPNSVPACMTDPKPIKQF